MYQLLLLVIDLIKYIIVWKTVFTL